MSGCSRTIPAGLFSWIFAVLCISLLLTACAPSAIVGDLNPATSPACVPPPPVGAPVTGIMVQPDDGVASLTRELDAASCTIDLSVYLLSDDQVIASLVSARHRGIQVRVMLEEHPFGGGGVQDDTRARLEAEDVSVKWSSRDTRFSHAKYLVIDRQVAIVMNQNLTASAFTANREFAAVTTDPEFVSQAQEVFDRDWAHWEIDDPAGPLILSPTNSRERLLALIGAAEASIDLYAEVIRDEEIVTALGAAATRGVAVRLIVDESVDEDTQVFLVALNERGVEVRIASTLYIHAKLMVIDGELAVVGSQNPTPTSLDDNREVSIVVVEPSALDRCAFIFERDWQRSAPGEPV